MRRSVVVLLMVGCGGEPGPCPPRADVVVTDETSASPDAIDRVNTALDSFYELTGRDSLCLVEVALVDSISEGFLASTRGRYSVQRSGGLIELLPRNDVEEARILRHELCHALDWTEEIQQTHADDLLAVLPDGIDGLYDDEGTLWEAYGRVCEWGPRPPVDRWLDASCADLTFGTPGERVDERVTWSSVFDAPQGGGLSVSWTTLELDGRIASVWSAGDAVVVLEEGPDGMALRWLNRLDALGAAVPVGADLENVWVWPGSDRALVIGNAPDVPHELVHSDGRRESVDLSGAYGWGEGVVAEDLAAGLLVDPQSSVPLQHLVNLGSVPEVVFAPDTDSVRAGVNGIEWSSSKTWVLTRDDDSWAHSHHGVVANGVDTDAGRLFRMDAAASDNTAVPLLGLLTPTGDLLSAGCDAVDGLPALLADLPVVVRVEGTTVHVGVVSIDSEYRGGPPR